jgi:hypothetical protein
MLRRKKLVNWIRICRRLNSIDRRTPFYHRKRQLWVWLNRWLKFMELEATTATPNLGREIKRRAALFPALSKSLAAAGFLKVVYFDNRRLEKIYSIPEVWSFHLVLIADQSSLHLLTKNVFNRWKMLTQENLTFRILSRYYLSPFLPLPLIFSLSPFLSLSAATSLSLLLHFSLRLFFRKIQDRFRLRLLRKCFWAIKTNLPMEEILSLIALSKLSFPLARIDADIEQIRKRFMVTRKKGLAQVIAKYNRKYLTRVKSEGRATYSFKRFIRQFRSHTQARISAEQRLLTQVRPSGSGWVGFTFTPLMSCMTGVREARLPLLRRRVHPAAPLVRSRGPRPARARDDGEVSWTPLR